MRTEGGGQRRDGKTLLNLSRDNNKRRRSGIRGWERIPRKNPSAKQTKAAKSRGDDKSRGRRNTFGVVFRPPTLIQMVFCFKGDLLSFNLWYAAFIFSRIQWKVQGVPK